MAEYRVPILTGYEWQKSVLDKDLIEPPSAPFEGDRYLVANGASGDWLNHDGDLTWYEDGSWHFITKKEGMFVYVKDEDNLYYCDGVNWLLFSGSSDNDWQIDTVNNYVYNVSDKIGIGTSSPQVKLHVENNVTSSTTLSYLFNPSLADTQTANISIGQSAVANCTGNLGFTLDSSNGSKMWLCLEGDDINVGQGIVLHKNGVVDFSYQSGAVVVLGTTQYLDPTTWTKVAFDVVQTDLQNEYNVSLYRFTALKTGFYTVSMGLLFNGIDDGYRVILSIWKNGAENRRVMYHAGTSGDLGACICTTIKVYSGDYIEFYAWQECPTAKNLIAGEQYCYASINKIA